MLRIRDSSLSLCQLTHHKYLEAPPGRCALVATAGVVRALEAYGHGAILGRIPGGGPCLLL